MKIDFYMHGRAEFWALEADFVLWRSDFWENSSKKQ